MMRASTVLIMALTLTGCGMKGDLYQPAETPAEGAAVPAPADGDQDERKTIPATPDPALSR